MTTEEQEYYIVSIKHTSKADAALTLWCANSRGYCWDKKMVGVYSLEELVGIVNDDNIAVLKSVTDKLWMEANDFGDRYTAIPNNTTNLKILGLTTKLMKPSRFASCRMKFTVNKNK